MTPKVSQESFLDLFHPLIHKWFRNRFSRTTDVQEKAWPCISRGEHLLITAPTGSGKTLTAFLWAIHQLGTGVWARGSSRVLYVSPLKALNNDIQQNLLHPLAEIQAVFQAAGQPFPEIRVLTRSGDTPQKDRRKMSLHPPEILITTPESLNLMISSSSGRQILRSLATVILDEIHAVAGSKRGVHMMTAVERLVSLSGEFQRIALSATLKDLDPVARFVGGFRLKGPAHAPEYIPRPLTQVQSSLEKRYQIQVCFVEKNPEQDKEITVWDLLAEKFKNRIEQNRSTLFFTNGRRLCEKLTFKVNKVLGQPLAYSHHGSLSRELRQEVEQKLKNGELKAIIATSSLEMGIDIGALDEVVLVQSPPTVSAAVQRMGRAGHQVGSVSRGTIFPAHTQDLIGAAVLARAIDQGDIESLTLVKNPLDVLAQVLVSMVGQETWDLDELYAAVRTADSFHTLGRDPFDRVVNMLAGQYAETRIRELKPRISIDRLDNTVQIKKGSLLALYMSGGTIPDRGYFQLRHTETHASIGELDEEYVWEAKIGQIATLGTQNWRITRITHNDVFALPAGNRKMEAPFWIGENLNRDFHFSQAMGVFLEKANGCLGAKGGEGQKFFATELAEIYHLDETAVQELMGFLCRQKERTLADLPHRRHLVLEYVRSGPGGSPGTMLVIHTLWGGRVNRPYALALEAAWENRYKELPEIFPGNDAVIIQLPHDLDPGEVLGLVTPENLEQLVRQRLESSGFFGARFRECAGRALLVTRNRINQRMPLWMTRLRSQKLLENVLAYEDFPILLETWRTCLQDEFDMPALGRLLDELASGSISWSQVMVSRPSPFAASMAWSQIHQYMYQEDQPASKTSRLGSDLIADLIFSPHQRPVIPDPVVAEFETKRHRLAKGYAPDSPRELVDWVKERMAIPLAEWNALVSAMESGSGPMASSWVKIFKEKLILMKPQGVRDPLVISLEQAARIYYAWYGQGDSVRFMDLDQRMISLEKIPQTAKILSPEQETDPAELGTGFLGQWLGFYGPRPISFVHTLLGLEPDRLQDFIDTLVDARSLVIGLLKKNGNPQDICDARNFETLVRMARNRAIPVFEALSLNQLPLFLAQIQGLTRAGIGVEELFQCIEQLGCLPLPAGLWETEILPARIHPYHPSFLDTLLQEAPLMWLGLGKEKIGFCFDTDLDFFKAPKIPTGKGPKDKGNLESQTSLETIFHTPGVRHDFFSLKNLTGQDTQDLVGLIWEAVWKGWLSNETFPALRKGIENHFALAATAEHPDRSSSRFSRRRRPGRAGFSHWQGTLPLAGRWYKPIQPRLQPDLMEKEELNKERARLLLDRYGILFRELVQKELPGFQWSRIFKSLYLMELSGEILAGYFFREIPGPQFISHKGFRLLQAGLAKDAIFWMNAMDPASPCGLGLGQTEMPRRVPGNHLVFKGETLVLASQRKGRALTLHALPEDPDLALYFDVLSHLLNRESNPLTCIVVETINGKAAAQSPYAVCLKTLFDVVTEFKHLVLYRRMAGSLPSALVDDPG